MHTVETTSRQDRRKARTRARIIDAAEGFFAAADADAATIARIAQAADVAVATVYQHFAGKDELHLAVVERALERNEQHMMAVYLADAPPLDKLVDSVGAYLAFYLTSPPLFRLIALRQGVLSDESADNPVAVMLAERVDRMTRALAGVVEAGVADGSLRTVSPTDTARFLWGSMNGVIALAQRPDRLRLSHDELLATLSQGVDILLAGLVADPDNRLPDAVREVITRAAELHRPEGES
ncbi:MULTISPECIES: TetR/AcrR family transcriptional regulator [unclassified Crossiella]|uniref:TetR/AcrR family transcriptional regulator n=1 Tax=unclassified Crossiella TaxID=2620835 RepID=UPI001FFF80FC|nr:MULTISPECIES: TetR/AcrR family transcriptional regulator [unclassified Crossiella]MCK2243750.1 TetR/AcrR family transcriptional regulator [Crossiella sp. S99.2]MCK2257609.1 TetR/AcrR family transcriptional regulator [Crossiella sp. S99.1]